MPPHLDKGDEGNEVRRAWRPLAALGGLVQLRGRECQATDKTWTLGYIKNWPPH